MGISRPRYHSSVGPFRSHVLVAGDLGERHFLIRDSSAIGTPSAPGRTRGPVSDAADDLAPLLDVDRCAAEVGRDLPKAGHGGQNRQ